MTKEVKATNDPEILAISEVFQALKELDPDARTRVLNYVSSKFNISSTIKSNFEREEILSPISDQPLRTKHDDEFDSISPAGKKWITRSGINTDKLMSVFSLGIDEIDLVSKSIPGKTKSQRMRNVFLLKGIAAYLGTGSPRFTHEQIKETCLHYDAWDTANFNNIFKTMSADVSGGKENGYVLTAKGISESTALIKSMSSTD